MSGAGNKALTVVIPVYNARMVLAACLDAVRHTLWDGEETEAPSLLLINDASTDPDIAPLLEEFAGQYEQKCRLLSNPKNLGFVGTVNRAFGETEGDVILLNSDTLPGHGWWQALAECARDGGDAATITPWSNNGEIVSLPELCQASPVPDDLEAIGKSLQELPPLYPELPTAVGFCMLVTRRALDAIGGFNSDFGLGYGEENDFSLRARAAGLRNLLCDNAYVAHVGNQSFGPRGLAPSAESMARLTRMHPDYPDLIAEYISRDPLQERRQQVLLHLASTGIELPGKAPKQPLQEGDAA